MKPLGFKWCFVGLLLVAICCDAHESILDADHHEMDQFDEEPTSLRDSGSELWHRFDEEVAVGLHDGISDEELSPAPSAGYSQRTVFDVRYQFGAVGDGITNDTDVCATLK
jgi:hypothetical protein